MSSVSLHQFLVLYTWFPLAALLLFLLLIARFYARFSGIRTWFWWYTVPVAGLGAAAVRYASIDTVHGDAAGALLLLLSGGVLLVLCLHLYRVMLVQRP
ncbi:MAG: hypothetical protein MUE40_00530 [Anaerolineae bacterium]|nr:hypothetical protein [Anaerolineae bacterium]